jgi:hypothetical protein
MVVPSDRTSCLSYFDKAPTCDKLRTVAATSHGMLQQRLSRRQQRHDETLRACRPKCRCDALGRLFLSFPLGIVNESHSNVLIQNSNIAMSAADVSSQSEPIRQIHQRHQLRPDVVPKTREWSTQVVQQWRYRASPGPARNQRGRHTPIGKLISKRCGYPVEKTWAQFLEHASEVKRRRRHVSVNALVRVEVMDVKALAIPKRLQRQNGTNQGRKDFVGKARQVPYSDADVNDATVESTTSRVRVQA